MVLASEKLTKEIVDAAAPKPARYEVWDCRLPGLGLRVEPSGTKTFILRYRPVGTGRAGLKRFLKIGRYGPLTPEQARRKAKELLGQVANGKDPAADLAESRAAITVANLAGRYLQDEVGPKRKPGTAQLYGHYLNRFVVPEIGRLKAASVTRATIAKLHVKIGKRHAVTANRVLATLSGIFAFGEKRSLLPAGHINPAKGIEKFREAARERYLTTEELERLGAAVREAETTGVPWDIDRARPASKHLQKTGRLTVISPFAAAAIRLLLFTGCRLREILDLKWSEVDFERGILNLSDSKTGRKPVILNAPALSIIAALPQVGDYVISGDSPTQPRSDLKRPWMVVTRRASLDGLRLHDLRHSYASVGAGAGFGLPVIGKLLGHRSVETTQKYAHLDADPIRRATNTIGATIAAALEGRIGAEIAPIRNGRPRP
jgi:integrase